jgi:DNA-binding MarR family transcriptional regulator
VTRIYATKQGRVLHDRLVDVARRMEADVRSLMSDRDAAVLERVLRRIDDYLSGVADVG